MKVALMNEFSQAAKNELIFEQLQKVAARYNFEAYNTGMLCDGDEPYLTYLNLGVQAFLLLNSKAVDFVVAGCGTGEGAMMALNAFPGVVCGLIIDPADAFLFSQINNGNAVSMPFAKGFGWGAELNVEYVFDKLFSCEKGQGYPPDRKESQNTNARRLNELKEAIGQPVMDTLRSIPEDILKAAIAGKRFQDCFFAGSQCEEMTAYVTSKL